MITIDYASLQATAAQAIEAFGRPAILRPMEGGADIAVTAIMSNYGTAERDGALIGYDDRRALIKWAPGVDPDPELHRFVLDNDVFRIVKTRTVQPNHTILYFDCQVRK